MARSTMADLISRLRDMVSAGSADYTVGTATYWTDDQLQQALDAHRREVFDETLSKIPQVNAAGSTVYTEYRSAWSDFESTDGGTAIFYLRDSTGARAGTASYTVDYRSGRITFSSDTLGSAYYLTGRSYDLNAAAADIWEQKAAHVANRFDFEADGGRYSVSKLVEQYERQAQRFRAKSGPVVGRMIRDDLEWWA